MTDYFTTRNFSEVLNDVLDNIEREIKNGYDVEKQMTFEEITNDFLYHAKKPYYSPPGTTKAYILDSVCRGVLFFAIKNLEGK